MVSLARYLLEQTAARGKKVRVAIDWALDVFFSKDFVQYLDQRALATSQTETDAAPWNRDQLSDPSKSNNRIAA